MTTHPLADLAWKVNDLMRPPGAREWFLGQCSTYLRQREEAEKSDREPPLGWSGSLGVSLTIAEKCAVLVALHSLVCASEETLDPLPGTRGLTWGEISERFGSQAARDWIRWGAVLSNVEAGLGPGHRDHVQSWVKDAEAALHRECKAAGGRKQDKGFGEGYELTGSMAPCEPPALRGTGEDRKVSGRAELKGVAAAAFKIIKTLNGRGISGKELVKKLKKAKFEISLSTLQKHIVPILKQHGVGNIKALGGYFIDGLSD